MKKIACLILASFMMLMAVANPLPPSREFYEIRTYFLKSAQQEKTMDDYLSGALIPALKRQGAKYVGVFKPIANDTAAVKKIVMVIPFKSIEQAAMLDQKLEKDKDYQQKGKNYIDAKYNDPAYARMERTILKAFTDQPVMIAPQLKGPKSERVYELRSYESASEKIYWNKVKMFNAGGEIKLFDRLGFNGIFYGEVVFGSKMPNLMYMTSFENMNDRNAHWKAFGSDEEWKKLSSMAEYQNNVSHADIDLMRGVEYSDL